MVKSMRVCRRCRSVYGPGAKFCGIDGQELVELEGDPLLGQKVDRYEVQSLLGRGASASVYKALHAELRSPVALKVLHGQLGSDAHYVQRFRREAQVVSRIRNPHVVSVLDFGIDQGLPYLVMEFCQGTTLDRVIAKEKPISPERAARVTAQIATGLSAAHEMGFVHRDVKPGNVAIERQAGRDLAKLLDFGIVRLPEIEDSDKLTQVGTVVGTPSYMAPEQTEGKEVTPASDLYAVGVVLYEMLAGRKPFTGTAPELFHKHRHEPPPAFEAPAALHELTLALLQKDPARRPPNATAVAEAAKRIEVELRGGISSAEIVLKAPGITADLLAPAVPSGSSPSVPAPSVTPAPALLSPPETATGVFTGEGTLQKAESRWAMWAIGAALVLIGGGLAVIGAAPSQEAPSVQVAAPPSLSELEQGLRQVVEARGLALEDLALVPEARGVWGQIQDARQKNDDASARSAYQTLSKLAATMPISAQVLNEKLDRLDPQVAAARARVDEATFEQLKTDYLALYREVHGGDPARLEGAAKAILAFQRRLLAPVAPPPR